MNNFNGNLIHLPTDVRQQIRKFARALHEFRCLSKESETTTKHFKIKMTSKDNVLKLSALRRLLRKKNPAANPADFIFKELALNDTGLNNNGLIYLCETLNHPTCNITCLRLCNNCISKISPLQSLVGLVNLYLTHNEVIDVTPLEHLVNLKVLYLANNCIVDIRGLRTLTQLKTLTLDKNSIASVQSLNTCLKLETLYLGNNRLTNINGIESLVRLKNLNLEKNKIFSIERLQTLVRLKFLKIEHNLITNVDALQTLINLKYLNLGNLNLSVVANLRQLINLELLILDNNQRIKDISCLHTLTKLKKLYLYGILISRFDVHSLETVLGASCKIFTST